jgi:hypothetical protein
LDWAKSPAAILPDISFVAAGERRDFRRLHPADPSRRFRRTSASLPPAKGVTFAGCALPTLRSDLGDHQLLRPALRAT